MVRFEVSGPLVGQEVCVRFESPFAEALLRTGLPFRIDSVSSLTGHRFSGGFDAVGASLRNGSTLGEGGSRERGR
jgi:hypothetical protein